ncbi:MAG: RNA polymerase sigma factor [Patescibacteria group bacterium]
MDSTTIERLRKYLAGRLKNSDDAEEIFQETLISVTQSLPTFQGNSSFFTWVCGIANHEIADFYRKKKIKTFLFSNFPFLENIVSEALGPEEKLLEKEIKKKVKDSLGKLSEGYSLILRLKYYHGLSMQEIADRMGITVKAVESRLSRARLAFRLEWLRNQ